MNLITNIQAAHLLNNNTIRITWDASTTAGVTEYKIYRAAVPFSSAKTLIATVSAPTIQYDDVIQIIPIQEWYYWVAESDGSNIGPMDLTGKLNVKENVFDVSPFTPIIIDGVTETYPDDEDMDYFFQRMRYDVQWECDMQGEIFKLLKMRREGTYCPLITYDDGSEQCPHPLGDPVGINACYGTGFTGGYYPAVDIKIKRLDANRILQLGSVGFNTENKPQFETIWTPRLASGDMIIDQMNQRWEIIEVTSIHFRGLVTVQKFTAELKQPRDIIYRVPVI